MLKAREILDELEGVSRLQKGKNKLVFDDAGKLSTGYEGKKNVVNAGYFFGAENINPSSAKTWHYRDELQQRLVRQARRLPYEVPAFYLADKFLAKPLFNGPEEEPAGPKKKWYDPSRSIDVAKELAVTTLFQMGGFMLPTAALGAAKDSSLNFYRTAQKRLISSNATGYSNLSQGTAKHTIYEKSLNLQGVLQGVGHDLFSVLDKSIKFSERSSGAMSSAFIAMSEANKNPVAALYSQRHGSVPAPSTAKPSRKQVIQNLAKDIYKGDKTKLNLARTDSMLDLIPGYKAVRQGAKTGYEEYKKLSFAQTFLDKPGQSYNKIQEGFAKILNVSSSTSDGAKAINESLIQSTLNIQRKRSSDVFNLLKEFSEKTGSKTASDSFQKMLRQGAYKDKLQKQLIDDGLSENVAKEFSRSLSVSDDVFRVIKTKSSKIQYEPISPTQRLSIGNDEIVGEDFFGQLISRFNSGKIGKNNPIPTSFTAEQLRNSVEKIDNEIFSNFSNINYLISPNKAFNSARETFEKEVFSSVLKPQKLNRQNFLNSSGLSAKASEARYEMAKKAGKIFGLDEKLTEGELRIALADRGLDVANASQLRAYLMNNKEMIDGQTSGLAKFFGLKGLSLDDGTNSFLQREQNLLNRINDSIAPASGVAASDLKANILAKSTTTANNIPEFDVLNSIRANLSQTTLSNVKGYYQYGDELINFNPIKSGFRKLTEALATEIKVPIIGINPMQMLGYKDFAGMAKAGRYQVSSGSANQPFVKGSKADFYTWHSTGGFLGTKGRLYSHSSNGTGGRFTATAIEGTYRPIQTGVSSMFTGTAELAAGQRTKQTRTATNLVGKIKERLDYSGEQPNSLFRFFGRLVNRQADVENEAVMARLISGKIDETFSIGGFGKKRNLQLRNELDAKGKVSKYSLVDADSSAQVASHSQLMEAFTRFANRQLSYGTNKSVQRKVIQESFDEYDSTGLEIDDITSISTPAQARKVINSLEEALRVQREGLRSEKAFREDDLRRYQDVSKAFARIKSFADVDDFSQQSRMFEKSSSIVTKGDEMSSEVFRFLLERKAILTGDPLTVMKNVSSAVDDLAARGIISSAQKAEAQASALSTIFNLTAFKTYEFDPGIGPAAKQENVTGVLLNPLRRFEQTRELLTDHSLKSLLNPHIEGSITTTGQSSLISQLGINKPISLFKKNLGMGKYVEKPSASSLSGQSGSDAYVFAPTFGTALKRNPKAALLSAAGIKTYGNEEGFSLASVPISHGFNRLNRYFGTVGSSLDPDNFHGPLDMYFRGMNAERVLPAVAIGSTALAVDRTIGGYASGKDDRGERAYSPFALGAVARVGAEAQAAVSGVVPGGMGYGQKRQQLLSGEVPIRKGRFWPLGNTKFSGGKIEYYRPSWYRRFQGGAMFTSDTYGSPMEKLLYYNDFSPLRPLDPYRFEKKHYQDRPYPVTGEYFSGPFGAAVPILNATIGRVLKPQRVMHKPELDRALSSYVPVGASGAYMPSELPGNVGYEEQRNPNVSYPAARPAPYGGKPLRFISPLSDYASEVASSPMGGMGQSYNISRSNKMLANSGNPLNTAGKIIRDQSGLGNSILAAAAYQRVPVSNEVQPVLFGPPTGPGIMPPKIVASGLPIRTSSNEFLSGELGYRLQETFGIYGFAGGNLRASLGLGSYDFEPNKSVLQSASKAYGTTRAFWDLNLGGLGDIPLQAEGALGNIEASEIVRRFIPKERTNVNFINPIKNTMGKEYPFLPNSSNFIDFTTGDPFTKVKEGELRLPGVGYERFNRLYSDNSGRYGAVNQLDILADVAPYSKEFRAINSRIDKMGLGEDERNKVGQIRAQLNSIENSKTDFTPYSDYSFFDKVSNPIRSVKDTVLHTDNFVNNKFIGKKTATEDWERRNVYGSTFPEWQNPVDSFIKPIYDKGTQRNPLLAAGVGAFAFAFFGKTKRMQTGLAAFGAVTTGGYSAFQKIKEDRYLPLRRKKELALEEYVDILSFVKNKTAATRAERFGDIESAKQFTLASKKTMYGADLNTKSIDQLAAAVPKRKREHFKAMLEAPEDERGRILSTAGRLERRLYEAAWGLPVERKPDLVNYFTRHELPGPGSEVWHPNTNMEHVKIKIGQSMGLEMSQMGYFPQQIKEANLVNPSYPTFGQGGSSQEDVRSKLQRLMFDMGINGNISPVMDNSNPGSINIMAGIRG